MKRKHIRMWYDTNTFYPANLKNLHEDIKTLNAHLNAQDQKIDFLKFIIETLIEQSSDQRVKDLSKVKQTFDSDVFLTFDQKDVEMNGIKAYLDRKFSIDSELELTFRLNTMLKVNAIKIQVYLKAPVPRSLVPVVIDPNMMIQYDPDVYDLKKLKGKPESKRTHTTHVDRRDVSDELKRVYKRVKDYFRLEEYNTCLHINEPLASFA